MKIFTSQSMMIPTASLRMLQRIGLLSFLLFTLSGQVIAQSWQWGRQGGSPYNGLSNFPVEGVVDMSTDKWGNTYALALVESLDPYVNGQLVVGYGNKDILVFSYDCNGVFRWSKVIGGGHDDAPTSIGTDTLGHVYVCGRTMPGLQTQHQVHFSTDSALALTNEKLMFLVQYDTAGKFNWLRQPSADTSKMGAYAGTNFSRSYDMVVADNGDVYWWTLMNPGLVSGGGGWAATGYTDYILKYNTAGNMTDHIPIALESRESIFSQVHFSRSKSGNFVFGGSHIQLQGMMSILIIGGLPVANTMFLASFNNRGQLQWKKENSTPNYGFGELYSRPQIDDAGNIYISGKAVGGTSFNGYTFNNPLSSLSYTCVFISKVAADGSHLWTRNAGSLSDMGSNGLAFRNKQEIWLYGTGHKMWWDNTYHFSPPLNTGAHFFVARLNDQGVILGLDSLSSNVGDRNSITTGTSDRKGNLYVGGQLDGPFRIGTGPQLYKAGGLTDLFLAKFGYANCNCTSVPVAAYTHSVQSGNRATFTYTGTASVDSVVWNYGNGVSVTRTGTGINQAFSYTYPAGQNGNFNICVTAYNGCGSSQTCKSVTIGNVSVPGTLLPAGMRIYPNPAHEYFTIEGSAEGMTIAVFNMLGQQVLPSVKVKPIHTISLTGLAAGSYIYVLTDKAGTPFTGRIVKQ
jgi:hypothetical protein